MIDVSLFQFWGKVKPITSTAEALTWAFAVAATATQGLFTQFCRIFFSKEKPMFEAPSRRPLASWHWIDGTRTCAEMHIVHEAAVPCGDGCLQEMAVRGTATEGGFLWCRCSYSMIHPIHVTCVASSSQCLTTQRWFKSWKSLSHLSQADIDGCGKTNDSDHNKKNGRCLSN